MDRLVTRARADRDAAAGSSTTASRRRPPARRSSPARRASSSLGTSALEQRPQPAAGRLGGGARATGIDARRRRAASGSAAASTGCSTRSSRCARRTTRRHARCAAQGTDVDRAATSGYFVLAGIEGAQPQTPAQRRRSRSTPRRGGNTARVIVVPEEGRLRRGDGRPCGRRSSALADDTAKDIGARERRRRARRAARRLRPGDLGALPVPRDRRSCSSPSWCCCCSSARRCWRSCAVLLNLVTVGAAVGVLILGFQTDPPLLGGPGYLDAIALSGIFAIIFGLSIDYEVFLISRLVEGRALTGHDRGRDPLRPREDRHDHHRRGRRDGVRVPRLRGLTGREHAPVRDRPDGRGGARRDGRAPDPAAGADQAVRRAHLGRPGLARPDPARISTH